MQYTNHIINLFTGDYVFFLSKPTLLPLCQIISTAFTKVTVTGPDVIIPVALHQMWRYHIGIRIAGKNVSFLLQCLTTEDTLWM